MLKIILSLYFVVAIAACQKAELVDDTDGTPNTKGIVATNNCPNIVGQYTCTEYDGSGRSFTEPLTVTETLENGVRVFIFTKSNSSGTQKFNYYNDAKVRTLTDSKVRYFTYCQNGILNNEFEESDGQNSVTTTVAISKNLVQMQSSINYVRKTNGQITEQARETRYCKSAQHLE